jgi:shikimate dehydrogenase
MKKAAVIGHPIEHSLSPKLHGIWLEEESIDGEYGKIDVRGEDLQDFFKNFNGLEGVNITVPHKEASCEIIKKIGRLTKIAEDIGAVNTVYLKDGVLVGTNTDYEGFRENLLEYQASFSFVDKKILIIGAGGAARAIIYGLLGEGVKEIVVANRTVERAENLQKINKNQIVACGLEGLEKLINEVDLVVNTTSCGLNGENDLEIDFSMIKDKKIFYDIVYKPLMTGLLTRAQENGHDVVTGLGMLFYQAVPAFELFFGKRPKVSDSLKKKF